MLTAADHDPVAFAALRRHHPRLWPNHRRFVRLAHDEAARTLREIDAELEILSARRRDCVDRLRTYRRRLYPGMRNRHHRRTRLAHDPPMPPAPADATELWGIDLRRLAVAVLHRHGPVSLRELHGLLHRYGYRVRSERPVQRLADALAYEARQGRATRVARGVYGPAGAAPDSWPDGQEPQLLPWQPDPDEPEPVPVDPDLRDDPERWSAGTWPSAAHPGGDWCDGPPDDDVCTMVSDLDEVVRATRRRLGDLLLADDEERRRTAARARHRPFREDHYEQGQAFPDDEYPDPATTDPATTDRARTVGGDSSTIRSPGAQPQRPGPDPSAGSTTERTQFGDDLG